MENIKNKILEIYIQCKKLGDSEKFEKSDP
jgi:hypothetical protein